MKKKHIKYLIKKVEDSLSWQKVYKYNFENDAFYRKEFYDLYRHKYPKSDVTFKQFLADRLKMIDVETKDLEEIISELKEILKKEVN